MEDVITEFGRKVKQLRKEKKWTQQELADKSRLHKNYIGMVERGERNPSLINIAKIANAFEIRLSVLMDVKY